MPSLNLNVKIYSSNKSVCAVQKKIKEETQKDDSPTPDALTDYFPLKPSSALARSKNKKELEFISKRLEKLKIDETKIDHPESRQSTPQNNTAETLDLHQPFIHSNSKFIVPKSA